MGRDSQDPTFVPNLIIIPFKMSAYSPQITEIQYKFAEKRYTPLYDVYKIWIGEGVQGPHLHAKFHRSVFKMWAYNLKNREKIAIFGINLPLMENLWGPQKKLNIGAQLQTFLYATTP